MKRKLSTPHPNSFPPEESPGEGEFHGYLALNIWAFPDVKIADGL